MQKVYLFHELGWLTAAAAVVLAAFGHDVRYLRLGGRLASDRVMIFLEQLGVNALSYEDVHGALGKYFDRMAPLSTRLYGEHFLGSPIEGAIGDVFNLSEENRARFSIACEHYLLSDMGQLAELLTFADEITKKRVTTRVFIVMAANSFVRTAIAWEKEAKHNINLIPLPRSYFFEYLLIGFRKYRRMKKNAAVAPSNSAGELSTVSHANEVLFFPHKGIHYGNLFRKDQYYSPDLNSPFHPSKILHLALGESPNERGISDAYYDQHGFPHADLNAMASANLRHWTLDYAAILWQYRRQLANQRGGIAAIVFYFTRYCQLRFYLTALDHLPQARIALVGYDILFPPILAIALSMRGVITVATQERFITPFQKVYCLILDYYFTISARVCRFLNEHPRTAKVSHCEPIGPVRAEQILVHQPPFPEKYANIKRERFLILALDFHSEPTALGNARLMANNWKGNKRFYLDMVRLAIDFPEAYFVIKGKDTAACTLPVMQDVMAVIEALPNISIEAELETYSPYLMAAMADFAIACHTSLGDEMLAVGKPVIFYDPAAVIAGFKYANYPVVANTYEEVRSRVADFVSGEPFMEPSQFAAMRSDLYSCCADEMQPRTRLRKKLDEIYRMNRRETDGHSDDSA